MTVPASWPAQIETAKVVDEEHRKELLESFEGQTTNVLIQEGPLESILQAAIRKNDIDLVVIGTRGRTGIGKLFLGSVAEEIIRTIDCPVLTVGPHADSSRTIPGEFTEILCATELKSESNPVVDYAVSFARQFVARIALVHVVANTVHGVGPARNVQRYSRELLRSMVPIGVEVVSKPEYFVQIGGPAERILEIADETDADLIVIGAHPEKGIPGAATHLPFAIAHKVIAGAKCPVLSIRGK